LRQQTRVVGGQGYAEEIADGVDVLALGEPPPGAWPHGYATRRGGHIDGRVDATDGVAWGGLAVEPPANAARAPQ